MPVFPLSGTYKLASNGLSIPWDSKLNFGQMFALVAACIIELPSDGRVRAKLGEEIMKSQGKIPYSVEIEDRLYQTFKIQMKALGLIELEYLRTTNGDMALFWSLTEKGEQTMIQVCAVRKDD